jgi:hypothetical protein
MIINKHHLNITIAAYDGCHKIYIPIEGQEDLFISKMEDKGWVYPDDFYKINNVTELRDMYIKSCPLRFIEQINFAKDKEEYIEIIPQGAFNDLYDDGVYEEPYFNVRSARKAFREDW